MLQRYLIIWLVLSSSVALWWQRWFPGLLDPFVASKPLLPWLITVTMFAIGCMLPRDEVRQVLRRWPLVLSGTAVQYLSMPTLAYCFAHAWGLSGDYLIGLLLVGCVPGAMASNVLTFNARGNTSYSVSLTTASTLLSPLAVPIALAGGAATGPRIGTGPGSFDMKGGLVIGLFAVAALKDLGLHPAHRLVLLFNSDEEVGSPTSRQAIEAEGKRSECALVLEPSREEALVTWRKGVGRFELEIKAQYRNMRYWLEKDMRPADLAVEAVRRAGIPPKIVPIRDRRHQLCAYKYIVTHEKLGAWVWRWDGK